MEYKITTSSDIDVLMDIRLEMLLQVNDLPDDYEYSKEFINCSRDYFLNGDQTTVLVFDGDRAIACASMSYFEVMPTFDHPTGKRAHLMNVYTHKKYRRMGIARKMIGILIKEAKKREVSEISLDATTLGRPVYETVGFVASKECMTLNLMN